MQVSTSARKLAYTLASTKRGSASYPSRRLAYVVETTHVRTSAAKASRRAAGGGLSIQLADSGTAQRYALRHWNCDAERDACGKVDERFCGGPYRYSGCVGGIR